MISTLKKLQDKKAAQENNGGFTLIELLIVIVVLGILAAVVVFSLGSVTSQSAVSACQADGATVNTAMSAYNANIGSYPQLQSALTSAATQGGPYLQSWPNNTAHYAFGLSGGGSGGKLYVAIGGTAALTDGSTDAAYAAVTGAPWVLWTGSGTCVTTGAKPTVK
jgi:prepilin-type N-terminal cleavage/methylation domain-containing protein